jgi:hypothetical protein
MAVTQERAQSAEEQQRRRRRRGRRRERTLALAAGFVLLLSLVAVLAIRALRDKALPTAEGYVAAPGETAALLDEEGQTIEQLPRGSAVTYVVEEEPAEQVRLMKDGAFWGYLAPENLTEDPAAAVTTETVYAARTETLTDESGAVPGAPVVQGETLTVTGFDGLDAEGRVARWQVSAGQGEGWVSAEAVSPEATTPGEGVDPAILEIHAARGDRWGGGDAAGLDYVPREKGDFSAAGNPMPDEVKALYLNSGVVLQAEDYLAVAESCGVNAFVVDVLDGGAVGYASPVMEQYSPSTAAAAAHTLEEYQAAVAKLREAGYYVIGRLTVFNDPYLAQDHPECVIADTAGAPLKIDGMYWPSVYSRAVWEYKVALALEAAQTMGFHEIQLDYVRFPDGTWRYDDGAIDYRNAYGESKAQAVQRFLLYAAGRMHEAGVYLSADVFGECAEDYVTAYGQYWPAISTAVDAVSAMPYPDHYSASGDYRPWEHPYDVLYAFGTKAAARQQETASPALVRTWIQAYNAIREPYNTYGPEEIAAEIRALRESGHTGGYMTWNAASSLDKYRYIAPALD